LDLVELDFVAIVSNHLLQNILGVPKASRGGTSDKFQRAGLDMNAFFPAYLLEFIYYLGLSQAVEIEPLAPRHYGGYDLVCFRSSQDKDYVWRRLLQCLQQGVAGRLGEHMHLVYDIYLVEGNGGGIIRLFPEATDFINAAITGGIYLYHIQGPAFGNRTTHVAGIARLSPCLIGAVDRFGQNARHAGLAGASWAAEKVSVGYFAALNGVAQSLSYRLLSHHLA